MPQRPASWLPRALVVSGRAGPHALAAGWLLAAVLALAGCVSTPPREESTDAETGVFLWPSPPERPRFAHDATLRSARDVQILTDADRLRAALGGRVEDSGGFTKAYDVVAQGGQVYVSDTAAAAVHVFDVPRRRYFVLGFRREGALRKPLGLDLDRRGLLYVADADLQRVVVFDRLGLFQRFIGDGETLERPTAVAVTPDGSRVYVVDTGGVESESHRIVVFDAEGKQVATIGERGDGLGQLNLPVDAALGPDGTLWVLDAGNFRVQAFSPDGRALRAFGSVGTAFGQFARPKALAVGADGNLFVSDGMFGVVQAFDPEGRLLLPIGRPGRRDLPGWWALPAGVDVDETGRLYVVDQGFSKVEVLRPIGDEEARRLAAGG
ncbi:MAG: 6-bladed beta-propeller [Ectothiorhodospiraceae bacterium]|nr:6-bladed beta-propeller [Chromatiales bacterium]MCP5154605.1 6-bladed beta-propeller [Ectothiorhodospiraceae bacterium]